MIVDDFGTGGAEGIRLKDESESFGNDGIDSGNELAELIRPFFFKSKETFDGLDIPIADL